MTSQNNTNNNHYGHLLDKYLDAEHLDWKTKQQRAEEAEKKYGHLLDYAKPNTSILERISRIEDSRIERMKQEAKNKKLADQHRQARIEEERCREEEHNSKVRSYAESIIERKQAQIKADVDKKEQAHKEAERQQEIYNRIDSLMKISPESANAYIQALKQGNVI